MMHVLEAYSCMYICMISISWILELGSILKELQKNIGGCRNLLKREKREYLRRCRHWETRREIFRSRLDAWMGFSRFLTVTILLLGGGVLVAAAAKGCFKVIFHFMSRNSRICMHSWLQRIYGTFVLSTAVFDIEFAKMVLVSLIICYNLLLVDVKQFSTLLWKKDMKMWSKLYYLLQDKITLDWTASYVRIDVMYSEKEQRNCIYSNSSIHFHSLLIVSMLKPIIHSHSIFC